MRPRTFTLALVLTLAFAACTPSPSPSPSASGEPSPAPSGSSSGELRQVRLLLSFRPDIQFAPFYLAQQDGYFERAGLDVTIEHADGGELIRLVAAGQADFGVADATDVMIARTSGIPVKYISTLYQNFPVAIIGPTGTVPSDPADLAGRTIGTPGRFGSSWHALLALLDAGGLTPDDVTIREYPQFNQVEGLLNGDVDLITGFRNNEPLRLAAAGMDTDLLTIDQIAPLPGPGLIAGDDLLSADVGLAASLAHAVIDAQKAIIADPTVGLAAAVVAVPTIAEDEATALAVLEETIPLWFRDPLPGPVPIGPAPTPQPLIVGSISRSVWTHGYQTMRALGFIDGTVPVVEMTDTRVVGETL
jgi:NitT/TauT family transport system substrate-binding protein